MESSGIGTQVARLPVTCGITETLFLPRASALLRRSRSWMQRAIPYVLVPIRTAHSLPVLFATRVSSADSQAHFLPRTLIVRTLLRSCSLEQVGILIEPAGTPRG